MMSLKVLMLVLAASYVVELTHSTGVVEFETWSSSITAPWHRLLDALQSAVALLPNPK